MTSQILNRALQGNNCQYRQNALSLNTNTNRTGLIRELYAYHSSASFKFPSLKIKQPMLKVSKIFSKILNYFRILQNILEICTIFQKILDNFSVFHRNLRNFLQHFGTFGTFLEPSRSLWNKAYRYRTFKNLLEHIRNILEKCLNFLENSKFF